MTWIVISVVLIVGFLVLVKFFPVPENYEYQISMFGKHWKRCKPGLGWRFRWFSNLDSTVFMGDQSVQLPLGRADSGGGLVNFIDEAASMDVTFYFKVFDSYLATYITDDVLKKIIDLADDTIRSFLGLYLIEDVNILKNSFDLGWIAATKKLVSGEAPPVLTESQFYQTLISWGIMPLYFIIGDTDMPEAVVEQIKRRQQARTDIEVAAIEVKVAKNKAKKALVDAEADRAVELLRATGVSEGMDQISAAMAYRVKTLMQQNGMTEEAARNHIVLLAKMEALKGSGQVIWSEGNSTASQGAAFGAGFNSNTQAPPVN